MANPWQQDPASFSTLYREHAPRLRAFLEQITGSPAAAEDLTQEIFTALWTKPSGYDPARGSLKGYLFGIGRHRAMDWWRREKGTEPLDGGEADRCGRAHHEQQALVADALGRLPEEQRLLLWLREVEGQSYGELAEIFAIPVGTVRSRLFTARQALGQLWRQGAKGAVHAVR